MTVSILSFGIALFALSLFTRMGPLLISNFLKKQAWIEKISKYLPCMILTLLLFHDIESRSIKSDENLLILLGSISLCLLTHLWLRQTILSIVIGVAAYATMNYFI